MVPVASANTTTTTRYDDGTVQRTYTEPAEPAPYIAPSSTTVTTDTSDADGTVKKQTTTTYSPN